MPNVIDTGINEESESQSMQQETDIKFKVNFDSYRDYITTLNRKFLLGLEDDYFI